MLALARQWEQIIRPWMHWPQRHAIGLHRRAQGSPIIMKKTLLTGIAALFLATGTAHANHQAYYQCGKKLILANIGKGFEEYVLILDKEHERPLPSRFFRWRDYSDVMYYRGRKCQWREWFDRNLLD
jgi:hypothetical protein